MARQLEPSPLRKVSHQPGSLQVTTLITASLVSLATPAIAAGPLTLLLPSQATIKLVNGQTISGIRLESVGTDAVSYEQGGKRSLPLRQVQSIAFSGPKGCRGPRQLLLASTALAVQPKGMALALDPTRLDSTLRLDLQQAITLNTLVVDSLHFDPRGNVRLDYKACSPNK
jgi:hypothetical protein